MKAINVARVSTEEQREAGNSLPAQTERIQRYCDNKGFETIKHFSFDESAYKNKRDEFDKLLGFVQQTAKKEKIAVCFDKVDRLSRSVFDKRVGTLYEMAVADEIELHFVSDSQIINNKMSAVEKFQFGMSLGLAKYYSDAIGDNVRRAFEKKRKNGEWIGAVKLGYLNVALDEGKRLRKDIIVDPERAHLIQKLFELYATGNYSYSTLLETIHDAGLRTRAGTKLSRSTIEKIVTDSFYCGTAVSGKYGSYEHKYPRLISRELFNKCQDIRLGRRKTRSKELSRDYIFKGLLHCQNCGCAYSPELKKKKSGKTYVYYSCTNAKGICKREYVNENELLKPILKVLDKFATITQDVQDRLVDELRKNIEAEVEFHKKQVDRIRDEYAKINNKKDRLIEMYLDDEMSITKDIYDKKHQQYNDKLQLLSIELDEHRNADYEYHTTVATLIDVARRARSIFENCSEPIEKRAFLNFLLQNPSVQGKKLYFSIASPFNLVMDLADCPDLLPTSCSDRGRSSWVRFLDRFYNHLIDALRADKK